MLTCIGYTQVDTFQVVNLDPSPNVTNTSGTCGNNGSDSALTLTSDKITVQFSFTNVSIVLICNFLCTFGGLILKTV